MGFLKRLLVSFLNAILFFSLSLFVFVFMLSRTLFDPAFVSSRLDALDIGALSREIVQMQASPSQQTGVSQAVVTEALYSAIAKAEAGLKEEAKTALYSGYNYFLGKSETLEIKISFEPVKTNLKDTLRQQLQSALPSQLVGQPQAVVEQYFNQFYQDFARQLPSGWEIREDKLAPETLSLLRSIRQYLSYLPILPNVLIGLMLLLVLGIILVERNLKGTFRSLGITLLLYGGVGYVIDFLVGRFGMPYLSMPGIPSSLQSWIGKLVDDILAPLQTLSIAILALGAVLLVLSFFFRRQQPAET